MKIRFLAAVTLVGLVAAVPALPANAKARPKPKPIHGSFVAQATPDPTSDLPAPVGKGKCAPVTPTARVTKAFTVPAAGTLAVQLNNKLDWSGDIRDSDGTVETDTDGNSPQDPEAMEVSFKKRTPIVIGACNFSGEPSITVTYTFTYK
ncbi:MAG: hypothetical protein QOG99_177 [Frankiales bacterium]|nr:hypothetical protein [Frankiales bacterium]